MAEREESREGDEKASEKGGMMGKVVVWGIIFLVGVGSGVAAALSMATPSGAAESSMPGYENFEKMEIPEPDDQQAFIEFDEVVVNLNDTRYSRFVSCSFSIQIASSQKEAIEKLVTDKQVVLTNWLIAHLREKKLEDVRGKLGHNALRREIHDKFNELLFVDGIERIQDVYFKDFKVQ